MDLMTVGVGASLSLLAAIAPTIAYVLLVYWVDRHEKEPRALLAAAFLWGALPAVVGSLVFEMLLGIPLMAEGACIACDIVQASAIAPVVEEVIKASALFGLVMLFRREFDGVLDGVIYGALVGLGFAMTENFFYFLSSYLEGGLQTLWATMVWRGGVFGPNHAVFTSVAGAGLGYGLVKARGAARWIVPLLALILAIILHAVHNLGVTVAQQAAGGLILSLLNTLAGVTLILIIVVWSLLQERQLIIQELHDEIGSTITAGEYELITSNRAMLAKTVGPLACIGGRPRPLLYELGRLTTDLAFKKHRLALDERSDSMQKAVDELRAQIAELRRAAAKLQPQADPWTQV